MKYLPISTDDNEVAIDEKATTGMRPRQKGPWFHLRQALPWVLTVIFASTSMMLSLALDQSRVRQGRNQEELGTFSAGFATDFLTARQHIKVEQVRFTGSPSFHANGTMWIPHPEPKLYVGDPGIHPEIDKNWDDLTWGRYILITKEEAIATWGDVDIDSYFDHQRGGYVAGLDMFHTLHCLNQLRQSLLPQHYSSHELKTDNGALHQNHCIEQIRQYIMCAGDVTPIPTKYYPALGRNYVDSDVNHTCRNYEALHSWLVDRYDGPGAVKATSTA